MNLYCITRRSLATTARRTLKPLAASIQMADLPHHLQLWGPAPPVDKIPIGPQPERLTLPPKNILIEAHLHFAVNIRLALTGHIN